MGFRNNAEIEASFRPVERMLDTMLEEIRARFDHEGITVSDESNRSGFDAGFPSYVWSFHFKKREPLRSEIKQVTVRLWYREPALEGESQRIEVTSVAEIFQICKQSRVCEVREMVYPIEQFLNMRMDQVIIEDLNGAEQILAKY